MSAFARNLSAPRRLLALLLVAGLLISLTAGGSATAATDYRGVELHSLWSDVSSADMKRELDLSRQLGSNVVTVDVGWATIEERGKGTRSARYVHKLDRFMAGARSRDLEVIVDLWSTPCWASSAPADVKQGCAGGWWDRGVNRYPPRNPQDFADIVRWLTDRYGDDLLAVEIWNEPNLEQFWLADDSAREYARLLKAAYPAAKAGNSRTLVLGGSLSHADRPFLEELYEHGIRGHYDGLAVHPFNDGRDPRDRFRPERRKDTFLPGLEWIRDAQQSAGDDTPIWATEFGWTTCSPGSSDRCVDEQAQARYLAAAFALLADMPYVKGATTYNLRNKSGDGDDIEGNYGLTERDYSPKPAFGALKQTFSG